jgi:hypothetical protein
VRAVFAALPGQKRLAQSGAGRKDSDVRLFHRRSCAEGLDIFRPESGNRARDRFQAIHEMDGLEVQLLCDGCLVDDPGQIRNLGSRRPSRTKRTRRRSSRTFRDTWQTEVAHQETAYGDLRAHISENPERAEEQVGMAPNGILDALPGSIRRGLRGYRALKFAAGLIRFICHGLLRRLCCKFGDRGCVLLGRRRGDTLRLNLLLRGGDSLLHRASGPGIPLFQLLQLLFKLGARLCGGDRDTGQQRGDPMTKPFH